MEVYRMDRPPIPEPLKRELRQESYFGCILCGNPIIQYHHIIPYSEVQCHEKENLAILCLEHHFRVTCGEIPSNLIIKAKEKPYNKNVTSVRKNFLLGDYNNLILNIGSITFLRTPIPIMIKNEPLLTIKPDLSGNALLSAKIYDVNNELLVRIIDNEWIAYKSDIVWDIKYFPGHLKICSDIRKILLEFSINEDKLDLRANMFFDGVNVNATPDYILWNTNKFIGNEGTNITDGIIGFRF
jgi:hypothetical protein